MVKNQAGRKGSSKEGDRTSFYCKKINFDEITEIYKRLFLLRNVALEIFLKDGRNYLVTFWDMKSRDVAYNLLISRVSISSGQSTGLDLTSGSSKFFGAISSGGINLNEITQKWCQREISNFQYLMCLNTIAGMRRFSSN
jgi:beige protein homolog 1